MQEEKRLDLQLFAESASAGEEAAAGVTSPDAGESTGAEIARKPWDEVRAEYKTDFDAEVQSIVQARVKKEQERTRTLAALLEELRAASAPPQGRTEGAATAGTDHARGPLGAGSAPTGSAERTGALPDRQRVNAHFDALWAQAGALAEKVPGFDLMAELRSDAFAALTQPGSAVSVEQAYYATHPEFRQQEAESVARRASEAVAASVRAGASRPAENGAQAASVAATPYRSRSRQDREALKARIYAAGARGEHLPFGE
ncbi:MAG: hypothetical protein IJP64_06305 [Oscillospiraceae bacterium]|nr:hypothetical protein [Oscillospiraceae bacterium]